MWTPELNSVYRIAHYWFSKLHVLPRTTFQPLKTSSSLQALTGFCWSLTWLFKAVYILIACPQVGTACKCQGVDYQLEMCQEQMQVALHFTVTSQRCLSLLYRSGDEGGGVALFLQDIFHLRGSIFSFCLGNTVICFQMPVGLSVPNRTQQEVCLNTQPMKRPVLGDV